MKKQNLEDLYYQQLIEKAIPKTYLNIISNPSGFVRGITQELSDDIRIIKSGSFPLKPDQETLKRVKYICEYSLSKMSDRRKKYDSDPNRFIIDNYTQYQEALKWVKKHEEN